MITKRKMGKGKVRVTFTMPPLEDVNQLNLVGDFNNWSITETPLKRNADGSWSVALTLEADKQYQYRYLANGQEWHNDWQADAYAPNEFGADNSLVSLMANGLAAPPKKAATKRKARGTKAE
ncbi:MAG: isoamylase early set domain-containing protein [Anaerolineales bacterium]